MLVEDIVSSQLPALDRRQRPLRDLRISVTDRCNFRCRYCMPREVFDRNARFLPHSEILTFEEITRVAKAFVNLGTRKLRLTGGEPLLRAELWKLVAQLNELGTDLALTTNGALLGDQAMSLFDAGLRRVTVSLDSLDPTAFQQIADTKIDVQRILEAIDIAIDTGMKVKVNSVIRHGVNDDQIVPLAEYFRAREVPLRFIEYMDVGQSNHWQGAEVITGLQMIERLNAVHPVRPEAPNYAGEVAHRWTYEDGRGEVGIITSVSSPFCGSCTRARLSAEGKLYTCLFATSGTDLRQTLRADQSDDKLEALIGNAWTERTDNYSERRSTSQLRLHKIEMSYIGG